MSLGNLLNNLIAQGREAVQNKTATGISVGPFAWELINNAIQQLVLQAQAAIDKPERKKAVHDAAVQFVTDVIIPIDLPGPDWVFDPATLSLAPVIIDGLIESAVTLLKQYQVGPFQLPAQSEAPAPAAQ